MTEERKNYLIEFGERVRKARKAKGLTMEELAEMTGYTNRSSIATIEKGRSDISHSKVLKIAEALEVSPFYLLFGEEGVEVNTESIENIPEASKNLKLSDKELELLMNFRSMSGAEQDFLIKMTKKGD